MELHVVFEPDEEGWVGASTAHAFSTDEARRSAGFVVVKLALPATA